MSNSKIDEECFQEWWTAYGPCVGNELFKGGKEYLHTLMTNYARAAWIEAQRALLSPKETEAVQ